MEATKSITIADWLLIVVTFLGPIIAVQVQKWIERAREKKNRRLWIFHTLMATRAVRAGSAEHVQALNLIDLFFDGKTAREKAIRNAWALYLDFLSQRVPENMNEAEGKSHNQQGVDFLVSLLEALALALGYDFNKVQLKRGGYYPQGHADESNARAFIRDGLVRVLKGEQSVRMAVVSLPVSEQALKNQQLIQAALLDTLSGQKPLKVELHRAE